MLEDLYPVRWAGRQAVVTLPEHIGVSNAGQVLDELLSVINRGATSLVADLTATISCDYAGADAVTRAYRRAVSSGTELLLAVTAPVVLRALSLSGLNRLVSVYPSLQAALAARPPVPAAALPATFPESAPGRNATAGTRPPVAGRPGALQDGVAAADSGGTIAAAITGIFHAGLSLQAAMELPVETAGQSIEAVLDDLDDLIREIRAPLSPPWPPRTAQLRAPPGDGR